MHFFAYPQEMHATSWNRQASKHAVGASAEPEVDVISLGRRVRHLRKAAGHDPGRPECRRRDRPAAAEPDRKRQARAQARPAPALAAALGVGIDQLLGAEPPSRRAALEIELERYQRSPLYESLELPKIRISSRLPMDVLESMVGLQHELERRLNEQVATPEEARRANSELRAEMRERNNYFPEYRGARRRRCSAVGGHTSGPLSHHVIADIAGHLGFSLHHVGDLPHSTRSVTDLKNRRIYLTQKPAVGPRPPFGAAAGAGPLRPGPPDAARTTADFLMQRVATNYFAAALLMPEQATVEFLQKAKAAKEIAVEDIRDAFAVSYETAAHRFTNLATQHLGIRTPLPEDPQERHHLQGLRERRRDVPADHTGAIEGQPSCRNWTSRVVFDVPDKFRAYNQYTDTPAGTYWCTARTERHSSTGSTRCRVGVSRTRT